MRILLSLTMVLIVTLSANSAEMGDDGLHKQEWFATTFKDIGEDMEAAADEGKRLAIVFEQRGCIYCRRLHEKVLSDPKVSNYIKENFMVVQYNLYGDEEVTDLDGEALSEKQAAKKWRILFTPTVLFMPEAKQADKDAGSPKVGDMIARNPNNHEDQWLVNATYFKDNLEEIKQVKNVPATMS